MKKLIANHRSKFRNPTLQLGSEYYIELRMTEMIMCKSIRFTYYCEELFVVKHKSAYGCVSAIFYDMGPKRRPCPPAYSWSGGLVQHTLKSDPALRDLEHVHADGPGLAYLFFHDRHGYRGLSKEEALTMRSHIADAFAEWIGRSAHFNMVPLLLEAGQQCTTAMQERHRQRVRPLEEPVLPVHASESMGSESLKLWVEYPQSGSQEGVAELETPRANVARPHR